jgi:hypothetical protein
MTTIKIYRGIEVTQFYAPSTRKSDYSCIINGKMFSSPSWDNLKKTIKKKLVSFN